MFEDRLKKLRLEKGLNMKQTALRLGIPYTTYVGYEKNEREPNSEILITLADFFNCSVDYLVGRKEERVSEDVLDNDLLEKHGNIYESKKEPAKKMPDLFAKKYYALDTHGKDMVNTVLEKEYDRCTADEDAYEDIYPSDGGECRCVGKVLGKVERG